MDLILQVVSKSESLEDESEMSEREVALETELGRRYLLGADSAYLNG